ncbi:hypothetical protein [Terracidiphilus gabretensis]|uniref:hypothetical protein n=1 Tax=Terracidiphilus gabretensis TaxID=1577687 RepID=UPI00071B447A|nr:hypothetical protein [Terracidiphilus gabretensis]
MKHLSEEAMVELYYGEGEGDASAHVKACRECAAQYAELTQSLDAMSPVVVPAKDAQYGERVWQALEPRLIPYEKKARGWFGWSLSGWTGWKAATLALGCAMLLAVAFAGGRYWERITAKTENSAGNKNPQTTQPTVVVVLTDHLDRTERLLVALEHADSQDHVENAQLQSEARELLVSNRLYRTTAKHAKDPALAGALDRLEGVLAEIANDPNLTAEDLQRVRSEMNTQGILFEIRVLKTRTTDQGNKTNSGRGASI